MAQLGIGIWQMGRPEHYAMYDARGRRAIDVYATRLLLIQSKDDVIGLHVEHGANWDLLR